MTTATTMMMMMMMITTYKPHPFVGGGGKFSFSVGVGVDGRAASLLADSCPHPFQLSTYTTNVLGFVTEQ